jgi:hypothetical protein
MAAKLVIEPIFEADFCESSYGFRPKRSAHDAVDEVAEALRAGHCHVIDADLSKYFDTISHTNLLAVMAERISDEAVLALVKQWLRAVVVEEDEDGTRRTGAGWGDYASNNSAKLPIEFSVTLSREGLRPSYGEGFRGAPLRWTGMGMGSASSDGGSRSEWWEREAEQGIGGNRDV